MPSILYRGVRSMTRRVWNFVNPRAIAWRHIEKRCPDKPIITKLGRDLKVRIYKNDVIGKYIYVDGMFEKTEAMFVTRFLKPGMVFLDVGANLGQYTLLAAHRIGGERTVHSFEPSARMFAELEFNVNLNGLSDMCVLNKVALSNSVGTANLSRYKQGEEVYGSLGTHRRGEIIGYESVKTTTLDAYIEQNHISHIDLLKMDIEGAEPQALRGAQNIIRRWKPKLAISIYHDFRHLWEVPLFLTELVPEYDIYIRHHTDLAYETVCYAVHRGTFNIQQGESYGQ